MKGYNEHHIRKAEIAQLILLYHIYAQTGSHQLIFQGGTALRWCYGGSRFSEDLDFVTALPGKTLDALLEKSIKAARIPEFFLQPTSEALLKDASEQDLSRFLPPGVMTVHRESGYRDFLEAVRGLFRELQSMGIVVA